MGDQFLHFLVLFLTTLSVAFAQARNASSNGNNIALGSSLVASVNSPTWRSASGAFAFGFHQIEGQILYLLAIWFDKIPNKTLVWYANGDRPAPEGSKLELKTDGQFNLVSPDGQVFWSPSPVDTGVSYASLLDTGNLILARNDSSIVWQSFDHPSDTILPTQTIDIYKSLSSRTAENNFSTGRFELRLIPDGNLVLNTIALPSGNAYEAYFWSNTVDAINGAVTGNRLIFNESGYLYIVMTNRRIVNVTSLNIVPARDFYYRAILEYDGVFTQYAHPKAPRNGKWESWSRVWHAPNDICSAIDGEKGLGTCGFNSYCMLDTDGRPNCKCLPGFNFSDPSNTFNGCERDPIQRCNLDNTNVEDLYDMRPLDNIVWPKSSNYEELQSFNEDQCRNSCLYDCNCVVAVYSGACFKKKMPVSNGRRTQGNSKAFVKVLISSIPSGDDFPYSKPDGLNGKKDKSVFSILGSILFGTSAFFNFSLLASLIALYVYHRRTQRVGLSSIPETNLRNFTFQELKVATDGFKLELGRGAFGTVYKGELSSSTSRTVVAVKKIDKLLANDGENEFKTEASVIAKTHHKNLVRLVGFCDEGPDKKILVYEFMSHGSLADFLFSQPRQEWEKRIRIAFGVAKGILYLHEECNTQIIHCDIKPQNILLDDSFEARISDFGLAKLLMKDQTRTVTGIRGTRGYVAPEWFRNTPVTAKVDVYSYGIVLLETICCRKCMDIAVEDEEEVILIEWVYDCFRERMLYKLVQDDEEAISDMNQLEKLVKVAIWCVQEDPNIRPSMRRVLHMLEGVVKVPKPPLPSYTSSTS